MRLCIFFLNVFLFHFCDRGPSYYNYFNYAMSRSYNFISQCFMIISVFRSSQWCTCAHLENSLNKA